MVQVDELRVLSVSRAVQGYKIRAFSSWPEYDSQDDSSEEQHSDYGEYYVYFLLFSWAWRCLRLGLLSGGISCVSPERDLDIGGGTGGVLGL